MPSRIRMVQVQSAFLRFSRCDVGNGGANEQAKVIGNFRKNMLIHPAQDRGLSIREAARLQSFDDRHEFIGPLNDRQQQVGDAVPPRLAEAVGRALMEGDES